MPKLPTSAARATRDVVFRPGGFLEQARRADHAGRRLEAIELYRRILEIQPANIDVTTWLGCALAEEGLLEEAIVQFDSTLKIDPSQSVAWINRGLAMANCRRHEEALFCYDRAIELQPDIAAGHFGRAGLLFHMGRFDEAVAAYDQAAPMMAGVIEYHFNKGVALVASGLLREGLHELDRALAIDPNWEGLKLNKAFLLLLMGQLRSGFELYEVRFQGTEARKRDRDFSQPLWRGETRLSGETILLHQEQGLGDTIQFCRYAPMVAAAGGRVVLEVQAPLVELMATLHDVDQVVAAGEPLPDFDLYCPLMSLPLAFGTTLHNIPAQTPYLSADPVLATRWKTRLSHLPGVKIGLVWAGGARWGNANFVATDYRRSMPLAMLAPLADVPGCSFVSLQLGPPADQAASPPPGMILHDHTSELKNFGDTAALIDALDLVIGVDTSTPHVAGAMGKPVWLMNRFDSCWRWLLERNDTPWYPTMRIFRQPRSLDWASVIQSVAAALRDLAAA
jgi:tetratricopeptide (TPR) repeat protein